MIPRLQFSGIEKRFFGVPVLKGVEFAVGAARVVGLVGENGAGKSTLMNLLGGNLRPDAGTMQFNGAPYAPATPGDAQAAGIGFVHQELNLFSNLSLAENLFLADFPTHGPFIRRRELHERSAALLKRVGLEESPLTRVERLSAGERQLVEVAHALSFDARLLILDEPTSSLSTRESERLFALVRQLRTEGRSVIYISHALGDVLRLSDDLVVLRDGEVVGSGPAAEFDQTRLVSLMVGRELKQLYPTRSKWTAPASPSRTDKPHPARPEAGAQKPESPPDFVRSSTKEDGPLLELEDLSQPGVIRNLTFKLHRGEVLGLAGLMGAGRTELARILFGLDPCEHGIVRLAGKPLTGSPRRRMQHGLAFLTESRRDDGLCLEASVADNLALVTLPTRTRTPLRWVDVTRLRQALAKIRDAVRLQPKLTEEQAVKTLSGGNQQKVVLAKWLLAQPQVFILDEPTRGIDVGAKSEIYRLIHELADSGAGVLMISSELEELTGLCDRILVLSQGQLRDELSRAEFDPERILRAALPT